MVMLVVQQQELVQAQASLQQAQVQALVLVKAQALVQAQQMS